MTEKAEEIPILDFDNSEPLFTAKDLWEKHYFRRSGKPLKLSKNCIITFRDDHIDYAKDKHSAKLLPKFTHRIEMYEIKKNGVPVTIVHTEMGSPRAIFVMEILAALGTRKFVSLGNAGSLQKDVKQGDIVLIDRAIRGEGLSYAYAPPSKYAFPSNTLLGKLEKTLESRGVEYHKGTSWTNDALFRETKKKVNRYMKEGVLVVEMESSAFYTVAKFLGVDMCSLVYVLDLLKEAEWRIEETETQKRAEINILDIAIDALTIS